MTPPYAGLGMWVWEADKTSPETLCHSLAAHNFQWVAVKAHDGTSPFNAASSIDAYRDAAHRHGLRFGLWGYLTAHDAAGEAVLASELCNRHGAEFYIADAEAEYESAPGPVSSEFVQTFRHHHRLLPAALSSFGRIDFHGGIDFGVWHRSGFDFMPQAYECESTELSPELCVHTAERVWSRDRIHVTVGTYQGPRGIISGAHLYESVRHLGLPGVNVWDAQELHPSQISALAPLGHGHPAAAATVPPAVHPLQHTTSPGGGGVTIGAPAHPLVVHHPVTVNPPPDHRPTARPAPPPRPAGLTEAEILRVREMAVSAAVLALHHAALVHYTEGPRRWEGIDRHLRAYRGEYPTYADCSAFVTWCLWQGLAHFHVHDVINGEDWKAGYTGTMLEHGHSVLSGGSFLHGDAVIYGTGPPGAHTALYVGGGKVISHGSEAGPFLLDMHYRPDVLDVRRYV